MADNPKNGLVSIVIPAYNAARFVEPCLNSCLRQTYPNIEIVLIDDGSKDDTLELAQGFSKDHPNVKVYHTENGGVARARNLGICVASGEWITFLDVDDMLCEDAVEVLLSGFEEGVDIISCGTIYLDESQRGTKINLSREAEFLYKTGKEGLRDSLTDQYNYTYGVVGKLFRAAFLQGLAFVEGKRIHEDNFFMFECCMREPKIAVSDCVVYCVFQTVGSASRGGFSERYIDILYFAQRKRSLIEDTIPEWNNLARNMWVKANMALLNNLCKTYDKQYKTAQRNCVREVRRHKNFFLPANAREKMVFRIIILGLFPLYKLLNYFRLNKSF